MNAPKYDYDDIVTFEIDGKTIHGSIYIIDAYGTFEQNEEPSYDIYVKEDTGYNCLYKHIRESWITGFIGKGKSIEDSIKVPEEKKEFPKSKRKTYYCKNCDSTVRLTKAPSFCPTCGSNEIEEDHREAQKFIDNALARINELIGELESTWDKYSAVHAEYEQLHRTITSYKLRHKVFSKIEIPKPNLPTLSSALKKYREQKNSKD